MSFEFYILEIYAFHEIVERFMSSLYPDIVDDFWEPVKVTVDLHNVPITILDNWECPICTDEKRRAYRLPCCRKPICTECGVSWFENENTSCPFCRKDLREFITSQT